MTSPIDDPSLDTALARALHAEGRLDVERLRPHLEASREARPGGPTLARRLVAEGALTPAEAEARLRAVAPERPDAPPAIGAASASAASGPVGPGTRVGAWVVERPLGRGGMGAVFAVRHAETQARRALKALPADGDDELEERFRREGEAMARADGHPHVLRVHEHGRHAGLLYLVVERVEGGDLADRLARDGPLPPTEAARLAERLAQGLAHAHAQGVLHRDLKPENVLLAEDGSPKLTDFGLARLADGDSLTQTGTVLGSPAYMAPEQAAGERRADERTDVYGLGAILYALLTGHPPFGRRGEPLVQVLRRVLDDPPPRPRASAPELPAALEAVCLRCLAKDPAARYPQARDVARDLARFRRGELRAGRRAPRALVVAGGLVLCAAAAVLAGAGLLGRGGEPEARPARLPTSDAEAPDEPRPNEGHAADERHRRYLEALDAALEARPDHTRATLTRLGTPLLGLGDPRAVEELRRQKRRHLASEPWLRALDEGWTPTPTGDGAEVLKALAAAASAPPLVPVPEQVHRALDEVLVELIAAQRATEDPALADAILRLEAERVYGFPPPPPEPLPELRAWVEARLWDVGVAVEELPPDLVLAGLRCDHHSEHERGLSVLALGGRIPAAKRRALAAARPESRAVAFLVAQQKRDASLQSEEPARHEELVADLRRATRGAVTDLGPVYQLRSRSRLAEALLRRQETLPEDAPPGRGAALLEEAAREARAARRGEPGLPDRHLLRACERESRALARLERRAEGARVWSAALAELRRRHRDAAPATAGIPVAEQFHRAHHRRAEHLVRAEPPRHEEARAHARRALAFARRFRQRAAARRTLANAHLAAGGDGSAAAADAALAPCLRRGLREDDGHFLQTALEVAHARGDPDELARRLEVIRDASPGAAVVGLYQTKLKRLRARR